METIDRKLNYNNSSKGMPKGTNSLVNNKLKSTKAQVKNKSKSTKASVKNKEVKVNRDGRKQFLPRMIFYGKL